MRQLTRATVLCLAVSTLWWGAVDGQPRVAFDALQPDLFGAGGTFTNAFADVEGDGDLDLFVGFDGAPNRLYRNTGGVFADIAARRGSPTGGRPAPPPGATSTPTAIPTWRWG